MEQQGTILHSIKDIQAITFDAVGTLIVPYPSVGEIYAEELEKLGYTLSSEILGNNFIAAFKEFKRKHPDTLLNRDSWKTILAKVLCGLTSPNDFERQFETLWNAFSESKRWQLLPGVEATLRNLHSAGLRLFVLSNNDERLYSILDGLSIGCYFEAVFVSAELGAEKPSNHIFELVQEWIKVEAQKILHVGDNPQEDVQGAMRAGWHAALVGTSALTSNITANYRQASSIHDLFFAE